MHFSKIQTVKDKPFKLPLKMIVLASTERISKSKRVLTMLERYFHISIFGLFGDNTEKSTFFYKPGDTFNPDILFLYVKTIILRGNLKGLSPTVRFLENAFLLRKRQSKIFYSL